jgi:hypothetical protein
MPLTPAIQSYYAVLVDGQHYLFTRAVMGGSPFADACHFVSRLLASAASGLPVAIAVYIDGIRIIGSQRDCNAAIARIQQQAVMVGATFNEDYWSTPRTSVEWNGAMYDVGRKVRSLTKKTLSKLHAMPHISTWTYTLMAENMGRIFHAAAVLGHRWCDTYYILKLYRRHTAKVHADPALASCLIPQWKHAVAEYDGLLAKLLRNEPLVFTEAPTDLPTLFVDASEKGWGGVLAIEGTIREFGSAWPPRMVGRHINILEALSLKQAVQHYSDILRGKVIHVVMDNTSAKIALYKQRSPSFELDTAVREVWHALDTAGVVVEHWSYVHTTANPADLPSRTSAADQAAVGRPDLRSEVVVRVLAWQQSNAGKETNNMQ